MNKYNLRIKNYGSSGNWLFDATTE